MRAHLQAPPSLSQLLAALAADPIPHTPPAHCVRRIVAADAPEATAPKLREAIRIARDALRGDAS